MRGDAVDAVGEVGVGRLERFVGVDAGRVRHRPVQAGADRPGELLVGAVLECLWTTFDAYARRAKLHYDQWSGSGIAVLERGPTMPVFTSISLTVDMMVAASDVSRAEQLLTSAKDHCIIGNALNVPIAVFPSIRGEGIQDVA